MRREQLLALGLDTAGRVASPPSFVDLPGRQLLEVARAHGLEGVVTGLSRRRWSEP